MSTALYLRVSTDEQSVESQRAELARVCELRGWTDVVEYVDKISGAKTSRVALDRMMADLRRGKVKRIVCFKLDRLGRSLAHLAQIIAELDTHKVALVVPSQGIDTSSDNPAARFQLNILGAVAEFERALIRERTRAGLKVAKALGRVGGRPKGAPVAKLRLMEVLLRTNPAMTVKALAAALKVSTGTAHAWKKKLEGGE